MRTSTSSRPWSSRSAGGYDMIPFTDPMTGQNRVEKAVMACQREIRPDFGSFEEFWTAYAAQTR